VIAHLRARAARTRLNDQENSTQRFHGKVAAVTGAGSGIGRSLAIELAHAGASVAISDINADGLADTAALLNAQGHAVLATQLDVTERDAVLTYADTVAEHFGTVNQIYNNAGIAFVGTVASTHFKEFERVMDVDYWSVVNGTKAFLPHLINSGDGHIVNISSVFGLFAAPGQGAYVSAKFAVRGFTEALRQEMRVGRQPVGVTSVHPGGIKTAIGYHTEGGAGFDANSFGKLFDWAAITSAQRAAKIILRGVEKNKARVLVGPDAKLYDLLVRATGPAYERLSGELTARAIMRRITSGPNLELG
jgi:NAD(P)-dependent dehydrogenase (short-subunit alcohol dehydrogenase family)